MNKVILLGRIVADIELRFMAGSGKAVCSFTIAVDKGLSKSKKEEFKKQNKPTADFPRVKCFGKTAEFVANYSGKGKRILVEGSITTGNYDREDGTKVYTTDVLAYKVDPIDWKDDNNSFNQDTHQSNFNQDMDGFIAIEDEDSVPF